MVSVNVAKNSGRNNLSRLGLYALAVIVVFIDQVTKSWAESELVFAQPVFVLPQLDWLLLYNKGMAFSFLSDAGGWQRWFLSAVAAIASIVFAVWIWRLQPQQKLLGFALAFVLAGALGNLYDRIMLGHVVDFISVYYQQWRWPSFNIADSSITIGAALLIIDAFKNGDGEEVSA